MTPAPTLPRDALSRAFSGDQRLVRAFEQQAAAISEAQQGVAASVEATDALQDASFLTLAANATLTGERVLRLASALVGLLGDDSFTIDVSDEVAHVVGGFSVTLNVIGDTSVVLPLSGVLATLANDETLQRKTLAAPRLAGIGDYADDAAAAVGSVPVGGVYRTGSALKVRIA